jgi:hypothetical protein
MRSNFGSAVWSVLVVFTLGILSGCARSQHADRESAPSSTFETVANTNKKELPAAARKAMLEVHASFDVDVTNANDAASLVQRLTALTNESGGFVASDESNANATRLVLRVPASSIDRVREILARGNSIARESHTATDVTEAIADVDARVKSARIEESRIASILTERTGTIADVLAAERALADVRERIERLEAEQRVAQGKVDLATVQIAITTAEATSDTTFASRASIAVHDGIDSARALVVGTVLFALRAGPVALLLALGFFGLFVCARNLRRRVRRA